MATNLREVCLDVYVNGVYCYSDSCWIPDVGDVDMEFELRDAIYDIIGTNPANSQISAELKFVADDAMSLRRFALVGNVVKFAVKIEATFFCECAVKRVEPGIESLADPAGPSTGSPENRPADSTKAKKKKKKNKIGSFLKKLFTEDLVIPGEPSDPEPEPALDLVDPQGSAVPDPKKKNKIGSFSKKLFIVDLLVPGEPSDPEPEPESDLVDPQESSVPEPEPDLGLVDPQESSVPELEPELDLTDAEESSVPGPSSSEPLGWDLDDHDAILDLKSPSLVSGDLKIFSSSGVDQDGIDASSEILEENVPQKSTKSWNSNIGAFFKWIFWRDPAVPEPVCVADASSSEPTSDLDLVDTEKSSDPEPESELDLADAEESSVPDMEPESDLADAEESSVPEPEPELDQVDPRESSVAELEPELDQVDTQESSVAELEPELDLADAKESSVAEPEPELDLADAEESSVPEPEPELHLVDPQESSVAEPEPELDLTDAEESSVPGPSSSQPLGWDLDNDDAILDMKSPSLVSGDLKIFSSSGLDQDGIVASSETPEENSPKKSTKVRRKKKKNNNKIGSFLKKLFTEDLVIPEKLSDPEPEPQLDLVDPHESTVPEPKKKNKICAFLKKLFTEDLVIPGEPSDPEPEPELDLVDPQESSVPEPEPELDLVDPQESSVPEPEPELDLVDPQESSVPEPEPELDVVDPQESSVPEPEPELDLVDPQESSVAELEPELDLADAEESSVPGPSSSEPLGWDLDNDDAILDIMSPSLVSGDLKIFSSTGVDQDGTDASSETLEENIPKKSTKSWNSNIGAFFKWLFWRDPAVPEPVCVADASSSEPTSDLDLVDTEKSSDPEPESELDLADAEESSVPDLEPESDLADAEESSVPEPEPELDLADAEESSVPELEPELDLADAEESSVPGPSSSESLSWDFDIYDATLDLKSLTLVSGDLMIFSGSGVNRDGIDTSSETPEENSPKKSIKVKKKKNKICAFLKKLFTEPLVIPEEPSDPEPEPELDLSDTDESTIPITTFLRPGLHLADSCTIVPRFHEPEPYWNFDDSDESCVPGPSSFEPKPFKQDPFQEYFYLEERVKGCTMPYNDVTQVWTNVFIGNEEIARDRMRLKDLGITHILNAAALKKKLRILLGMPREKDLRDTVDTGASYYRGMNISYCGLPTTHGSNISQYFLPAAEFIHKARKNSENKVFIHCTDGVSNAPTLFMAYLMIHQNKTVENAIDFLINVRHIKPEREFLRQLAILNAELGMKYQ